MGIQVVLLVVVVAHYGKDVRNLHIVVLLEEVLPGAEEVRHEEVDHNVNIEAVPHEEVEERHV